MVYPPPPSTNIGTPKLRTKATHAACPKYVRTFPNHRPVAQSIEEMREQDVSNNEQSGGRGDRTFESEVEASEAVSRERVGTTLQADGFGTEPVHDPLYDLMSSTAVVTAEGVSWSEASEWWQCEYGNGSEL